MDNEKAWDFAIGLVQIDGIKPSDDFLELVEKEKRGEITTADIKRVLDMKYTVLEYKGYHGSIEYSSSDKILFGKVTGLNSLISYEGNSIESLRKDFEGAIDDYLEMCVIKDSIIEGLNTPISECIPESEVEW